MTASSNVSETLKAISLNKRRKCFKNTSLKPHCVRTKCRDNQFFIRNSEVITHIGLFKYEKYNKFVFFFSEDPNASVIRLSSDLLLTVKYSNK